VQAALSAVNIPSRHEVHELTRKVDELSRKIDRFKR
jgi:polyhydroxyalkanoate synthesis regulator phasin